MRNDHDGNERALAFHLTSRLADGRVIATSPGELRMAARVMLDRGRARGLLGFRVADTHLHLVAACSRREAGALARGVESALTQRLGLRVGFEPARIRPVASHAHLERVLPYLARQARHHGFGIDPLEDGGSAVEVLGLRVVDPSLRARVLRFVPRTSTQAWLAELGWDSLAEAPMALDQLADAAAGALGLASLGGCVASQLARRAAVHVGSSAGLRSRHVADLLGMAMRSVQAARHTAVPTDALRAVAGQLRVRGLLRLRAAHPDPTYLPDPEAAPPTAR